MDHNLNALEQSLSDHLNEKFFGELVDQKTMTAVLEYLKLLCIEDGIDADWEVGTINSRDFEYGETGHVVKLYATPTFKSDQDKTWFFLKFGLSNT